jgi:hypothetical protein
MQVTRLIAFSALAAQLLVACGGGGGGGGSPPPAAPPPPPPAPVVPAAPLSPFVDSTQSSGLNFENGLIRPPYIYRSEIENFAPSGVASGDYDNDGDIDLFITRGDIGPNLLYRNNGFGVFVDVAAAANLAFTATATENYRHAGPTFGDMDGDGYLDLFIGGVFGDPSFIFRNNGDGTFTDVTTGSGIDTMQAEFNVGAAFGDYDLDGDLDMFIAHWGTYRSTRNPDDTENLWRNDSSGGTIRFTSTSLFAGISPSIITFADPNVPFGVNAENDLTFSPSFARIDGDLYPDIVVAADNNDSMVFMNNGDGTFDNATNFDVITDTYGMGSALGDYDDDGDLDWFVTSIMNPADSLNPSAAYNGNRFYRNDNGVFVDATDVADVRDGGWGWGACFIDFENDGDLDIYHTNGWRDAVDDFVDDPSRAFVSDGNGSFVERASQLGLDDTEEGRGVVCADFDNDGDVDILQLHRGSPVAVTLWRNDASSNNYLGVKLVGRPPNTEAANARIYATIGSRTMMREVVIGNNFVSQNPTIQIFGLGTFSQIDELRVEWPDGQITTESAVAAGQTRILNQP